MRKILGAQKTTEGWRKRLISLVLQFLILCVFWLVLSGHYEVKYISIGVVAAGLVTFLTNDIFHGALRYGDKTEPKLWPVLVQLGRFLAYLPWLLWQIILANVQVAYLILHPKMPIEPAFLLFRTRMKKGIARVTLANSITLTPGTVTVSLENGNYIIHNLKPPLASGLTEARLQNKVAGVYLEEKEPPLGIRWVHFLRELER